MAERAQAVGMICAGTFIKYSESLGAIRTYRKCWRS